jgi:hypothetical protein
MFHVGIIDYDLVQLSDVFFQPIDGNLLIFTLSFLFWYAFSNRFWFGLFWVFFALLYLLLFVCRYCVGKVFVLILLNLFHFFFSLPFCPRSCVYSAWSPHLDNVLFFTHLVGNSLKMIDRSIWNWNLIGSALFVIVISWRSIESSSSICFEEWFLLCRFLCSSCFLCFFTNGCCVHRSLDWVYDRMWSVC